MKDFLRSYYFAVVMALAGTVPMASGLLFRTAFKRRGMCLHPVTLTLLATCYSVVNSEFGPEQGNVSVGVRRSRTIAVEPEAYFSIRMGTLQGAG